MGVLALAACGPKPGTTTVTEGRDLYIAALRGDDPKPLYEMLSEEEREKISYEDWAKLWAETKAERTWRAQELADSSKKPVFAFANVRYADGQAVQLREEDRGWRLDQALVTVATTPTPEEALAQLRIAIETRDLGAMLSLLTAERRDALVRRIDAVLAGLDTAEAGLFEVTPERYELSFAQDGVRYRLVFLLEGANWRVDELYLGPDRAMPPEEAKEPEEKEKAPSLSHGPPRG